MLVAFKQEIDRQQKRYGGEVAGMEQMHLGADCDQQKKEGSLHGCSHTDDAELVVQFDEEIADKAINQVTGELLYSVGNPVFAERLP